MRQETVVNCEKQFIAECFQQNLRIDGRGCEDFRECQVLLGAEVGTALALLGYTKVLCAVSCELGEPMASRPTKGVLNVEVDMSPIASPSHERGRFGRAGLELTHLLELVLRDSNCVDLESLCVRAAQLVWRLRVDVRILDDDGGLADCATVAAIAALKHFKRPDYTITPDSVVVHSAFEKPLIPLTISHTPILVTFGMQSDGSIVVDPSLRELPSLEGGRFAVIANQRQEVCGMRQYAREAFLMLPDTVEKCMRLAVKRAGKVASLVDALLKDDNEKSHASRMRGDKKQQQQQPSEGHSLSCDAALDALQLRHFHFNHIAAPLICARPAGQTWSASAMSSAQAELLVREENGLTSRGTVRDGNEDAAIDDQVIAVLEKNTVSDDRAVKVEPMEEGEVLDDENPSTEATSSKRQKREKTTTAKKCKSILTNIDDVEFDE